MWAVGAWLMELDQKDRDSFDSLEAFEGFGEADETPAPVNVIDLGSDEEPVQWNPNAGPSKPVLANRKPKKITGGFSWAAFSGGLAALVWIAGAIGGPISFYGVNA